ncbi:hypothetical protein [Methylobacterium sp. WL9]|uniref:hypothetical protein n=1 Tax=Methylobacterium sp. WL9 TaxID=2603898 RepID=UPI001FEE972F|nr:hypothetical protein [Methylobacterium sp. WL9]
MSISQPDRRLALLIALALGVSPACAEDFTGFYAGVNAGYAFDRERHVQAASSAFPGAPSAGGNAEGLPPSALSASQSPAMRGSRAERPPQPDLPTR